MLTNQAVVRPTNAAMGSKDYLGDIQRMNPGEWMRFSFRTTKPAAMFGGALGDGRQPGPGHPTRFRLRANHSARAPQPKLDSELVTEQ